MNVVQLVQSVTKRNHRQPAPLCVLRNIDLSVPRGALVYVIGTVGAGKSSLLAAILSELDATGGEVHVDGTVAACRWILNMSVRDNVTIAGRTPVDEVRYQSALAATGLRSTPGAVAARGAEAPDSAL
eukprot:gene18859-678_t